MKNPSHPRAYLHRIMDDLEQETWVLSTILGAEWWLRVYARFQEQFGV